MRHVLKTVIVATLLLVSHGGLAVAQQAIPDITERLERLESKVDRLLALHEAEGLQLVVVLGLNYTRGLLNYGGPLQVETAGTKNPGFQRFLSEDSARGERCHHLVG